MRRIKVLHILHSFGIGGLEKGIAMLINHASADIEHSILCLTEAGESRHLIPTDIPIHEMHKPPGNSLGFIIRLAKKIRALNPDIVHTRNWGGMDGIIAARLAGKKAVVHGEHGWGMADPEGQSRKRKVIRRWLSPAVTEFTAVSLQIKTWLEDEVRVCRPVTQIYNGVEQLLLDCNHDNSFLRRDLDLSESAHLIGTVGRLDPIKDYAGLIGAFARVREQHPDCHLVIAGDGPERRNLEALAGEGVHLLGMRADIPALLESFDIFVLPSFNEGISNTILEAMAAGLPVVATAVGGTPELIVHEDNGLLVEPRAYSDLAESMLRYLKSPDLRIMHGQENQRIIEETFSIKAMVKGYEGVWRRVVEKET